MATTKPEHDALSFAVGKRIAKIMEEKGLSRLELAAKMEASPNYVWRLIDGRQNLSLRLAGRICLALGIELSYLFEGVVVPADIGGPRPYVPRNAK